MMSFKNTPVRLLLGKMEKSPAAAPKARRIVVLYDKAAAWESARRFLQAAICQDLRRIQPVAWCFDALATPSGRMAGALDLAKSDVLLVATSDAASIPTPAKHWLSAAFAGLRGGTGLMVALLGQAGGRTAAHATDLRLLQRTAAAAGWSFRAPEPDAFGPTPV